MTGPAKAKPCTVLTEAASDFEVSSDSRTTAAQFSRRLSYFRSHVDAHVQGTIPYHDWIAPIAQEQCTELLYDACCKM